MSAFPQINVKRLALSAAGDANSVKTEIVFSMFAEDSTTRDPRTQKGPGAAYYNSIKILIVQLTSEEEADMAITNVRKFMKMLARSVRASRGKHAVCTIKDGVIERKSRKKVEIVYRSPKTFLSKTGTSYLSYLFVPFTGQIDRPSSIGRPTIEEVVTGGDTVTTARVLIDPNGDIYTGPTHIHKNKIMAGARHTSEPHAVLQERPVHNSTIHDARILENMKKISLNVQPNDMNAPTTYISELFASRDEDNNCRFLFFLDFGRMAAAFSKVPELHSNVIASRKITANSRINSIKILRRVAPPERKNALFMSMPEQRSRANIEYIAVSKDGTSGQLEPNGYFKIFGEELKRVGNLKEINLGVVPSGIRAFSGIDVEMSEITDGIYQYGVELDIEDTAEDFGKQKLLELETAYKTIQNYYELSLKKGAYNQSSKQFNLLFRDTISSEKILRSVEKHIEVFNLLADIDRPLGDTEILSIFSLICPINGNPKNIQMFADLMFSTIIAMREILQLQHNSRANKNYRLSGDAPGRLKDDNIRASRKIVKWFDSNFNSNLGKNTGYYFFKPSQKTRDGHVSLNDTDFVSLIEAQKNKLFGAERSIVLSDGVTLDTDMSKYGYLSPLSVGFGGTETENLMQKDAQFYNIDKYNNMISQMIKFNLNKPLVGKESKTKSSAIEGANSYGRTLRNNLVDIFSSLSCTVENISAFSMFDKSYRKEQLATVVDKDESSVMTAVDTKVLQRQESPETLDSSNINPNNILNRLASTLTVAKIPSPKLFNVFDIRDDSFYFSDSASNMDLLPNQLKALISIFSGVDLGIEKDKLAGNHRDQFGFLYMNFMNIMKVEVLTGFADGSLSKPSFNLLNSNNLRRGLNLCRLTRYNSISNNLPDMKIEYPVYYEYFILNNQGAMSLTSGPMSSQARTRQAQTTVEPMRTEASVSRERRERLSTMTDSTNIYTRSTAPSTAGSSAAMVRPAPASPAAETTTRARPAPASPTRTNTMANRAPMSTPSTAGRSRSPSPTGGGSY